MDMSNDLMIVAIILSLLSFLYKSTNDKRAFI